MRILKIAGRASFAAACIALSIGTMAVQIKMNDGYRGATGSVGWWVITVAGALFAISAMCIVFRFAIGSRTIGTADQ